MSPKDSPFALPASRSSIFHPQPRHLPPLLKGGQGGSRAAVCPLSIAIDKRAERHAPSGSPRALLLTSRSAEKLRIPRDSHLLLSSSLSLTSHPGAYATGLATSFRTPHLCISLALWERA